MTETLSFNLKDLLDRLHPQQHTLIVGSAFIDLLIRVPQLPKSGADLLSRPSGSTIGAGGLNFSVRDGKRWVPAAVGAFSLLAGGFPPGGCDCHEPGTNERRSRGPYGQLVPLGFAVAGFAPAAYRRRRLRRP